MNIGMRLVFRSFDILPKMASARLRETALNSPRQLYKFLLRECGRLPEDAQQFYRHSITQSFKQHVIEPDKERVRQIMEKAIQDAAWVVNKYSNPKEERVREK